MGLLSIRTLPPESLLLFSVYEVRERSLIHKLSRGAESESVIVGHAFLTLCDALGRIRTGARSLHLFPGQGSPMRVGVCTDTKVGGVRLEQTSSP